jgi:hypothetical protein
MAITITNSAQLADGYRRYPTEDHGKLRFLYGKVTQGAAAGDIGSTMIIGRLPPGRVRVLPYLSRYKASAWGAARTLSIGHAAYFDQTGVGDTGEPAAPAAFASAVDVSAATDAAFPTLAGMKFDMYSRNGIEINATVAGGTIPVAATLEVCLAYITE